MFIHLISNIFFLLFLPFLIFSLFNFFVINFHFIWIVLYTHQRYKSIRPREDVAFWMLCLKLSLISFIIGDIHRYRQVHYRIFDMESLSNIYESTHTTYV